MYPSTSLCDTRRASPSLSPLLTNYRKKKKKIHRVVCTTSFHVPYFSVCICICQYVYMYICNAKKGLN